MRPYQGWLTGLIGMALLIGIGSASAQTRVESSYRKDGTSVQPYSRMAPNANPYNNLGYPATYNPNTGRITGGDPNAYLQQYDASQLQPHELTTLQPQLNYYLSTPQPRQ